MGCCFSTSTTQNQNLDDQNALKNHQPYLRSHASKSNPTHELDTRAPPAPASPPLEEESVKEVLSETPISKPHQVPILTPETKTQMPFVQNPAENFETKDPNPIDKPEEVSEVVVSQLSETCSMSESFSTATTATTTTATITEKREEDGATSKRSNREGTTTHKWNRSPSHALSRKRPYAVDGNVAGGRERRLKSPARRLEPSPDKKIQGCSRTARGRESGPAANRRLNAGSAAVHRDSGEGSGRRSRSPSCARMVGVGAGGGRKQLPSAKSAVEKEENGGSEEVGEKNDVVSQEESLANPHVSMECFIFL